jgi:thioredoxin 2
LKDLTTADFATTLAALGQTPALVDFWAPWCGPCRMLDPALARIEAALGEDLAVFKVDISTEEALAEAWNVKATPTFLLLHRGAEIGRRVGGLPATALAQWVHETIARI